MKTEPAEFKNMKSKLLIEFNEIQHYNHEDEQTIIKELEKHMIKKFKSNKNNETLNNTSGGEGGHHDKGDIQKLYVIYK